jgi:hypothetical protein
MRTADMIKSKFFRGKDLEGVPPLYLHIADVSEELMGRGSRQDVKCVMWFHENPKGLRLNKTAVTVLELAYGPDSDAWSGKRVKLYFDPKVEFGGRAVGGVAVATPPGVIYQGATGHAGWGDAPQTPPGAPPPAVWDGQRQMWITSQPPAAAPPTEPLRPPAPVWDGSKWVTVDPSTGEMSAPPKHERAPTISERINAGHPAKAQDDGWGGQPPPRTRDPNAEFDDDIPF